MRERSPCAKSRCWSRGVGLMSVLGIAVAVASGGEGERATPCGGAAGPDVIVGDLPSIANFGSAGAMDAFAVGTTSCNVGTAPVPWIRETNQHPVISQQLYRYEVVGGAGRFEQIGMSWVKHGYGASSQNLCCTCQSVGPTALGVGCSDPYTANDNSVQLSTLGGFGPRGVINPHSGAFSFPYPFRNDNGGLPVTSVTRRLAAALDDLDPALHPGAQFFVEGQYITPDDCSAGNQNNNCSYRACVASGVRPDFSLTVSGSVVRELPAIHAWKAIDSSVVETSVSTPEEPNAGGDASGLVMVAARATDLGGGTWRYEYAVSNINSDRCVASVSVPVAVWLSVSNIGFRDIAYRDGDGCGSTPTSPVNFDGTDWPGQVSSGTVSWSVPPANPLCNSNAIRWGTTYNFRFDVKAAPTGGEITLGMFKSVEGLADSVSASSVVPSAPCAAPVIGSVPDAAAICGKAFVSAAPSATGTPPLSWSLIGGPPAGMTINSTTGAVSWSNPPASDTPYAITIQASHSCSANVDSKTWHLTVARGDFTGDGIVGVADIGFFLNRVAGRNADLACAADVNADGSVDGRDVEGFVARLLAAR